MDIAIVKILNAKAEDYTLETDLISWQTVTNQEQTNTTMNAMLNIAVRAARAAGQIILRHVDHVDRLRIGNKGVNDFVTEVDQAAEEAIVQILRRAYPSHSILAEEGGASQGDDFQWVIDPLDGTTNFLHGFPVFAVSIALRYRGTLEQAVIYDPLRDELFTASRGGGARLEDRRLRIRRRDGLQGALLGTGFPFRNPADIDTFLAMFKDLFLQTSGIRRAGSAALDLAYLAAGRLDGFWEIGLKPWDMAAGALLIQEAGGLVSDFEGGDAFLDSGNIVAGAVRVHSEILATLKPYQGQVRKM